MTRLALCLLLLVTGASAENLSPSVQILEDKPRGVVCYVMSTLGNQAISCVKVWLPRVAGTDAVIPASPHEQQPEPTPALAPGRWIDERYEL